MDAKRLRKLKSRAADAHRRGQLEKALVAYRSLQEIEPASATWPQRIADVSRRLGNSRNELNALVRAADLQANAGFAIQAIALCKRILAIDPCHLATQERVSRLCAQQGSAVSPQPAPKRAPTESSPGTDAPLGELLLEEVLPGARPARLTEVELPGVTDIPLAGREEDFEADASNLDLQLDLQLDRSEVASSSDNSAALRGSPLFSALDCESLHRLISDVKRVELVEGEVLFRQGEPADALYVIAEGAVVPIAEGDVRTRLDVMEEGEFFGEVGLLTNQPRNATIEALVDTVVLSIDRRAIWQLIDGNSEMAGIVLRFLRDRLINRLVRTSTFFAAFSRPKRSEVANLFRFLEARDASVVIEQGQPAQGLFILLAGRMEVIHSDFSGDKCLATLAPGDLFGEMSLLTGEPVLGSVVASGKCWLLALSERSFRQILARNPQLEQIIAGIMLEREGRNRRTLEDVVKERDAELGLI